MIEVATGWSHSYPLFFSWGGLEDFYMVDTIPLCQPAEDQARPAHW